MPLELEPEEPSEFPNYLEVAHARIAELEAELAAREAALKAERRTLEAMKAKVEAHTSGLASILDEISDLASAPSIPLAHGVLKKAVRAGVDAIAPNKASFSTTELIDALRIVAPYVKTESNRANISMYLRELVEDGVLRVASEGRGQTPTFFSKK